MIKIIAAIGKRNELGRNGKLIWDLPSDLKFFKEQTIGSAVVMGRNTFNSLPNKLSKRQHYILTDSLVFNKDVGDALIYFDFNSLLDDIKMKAHTTDVFIIGGASIYSQFINYADEIILTEIEATCNSADVYFPSFDKTMYLKEILGSNEDYGIKYKHVRYVKK